MSHKDFCLGFWLLFGLPSKKGGHHIDNDIRITLFWLPRAGYGPGLDKKNILREGEVDVDGPLQVLGRSIMSL